MSLHVSIVESNFEQNDVDSSEEKSVDLCLNFKCESGENCVVKNNEASCECTEICEIPNDERQKVFLAFSFSHWVFQIYLTFTQN